MLCLCFAVFLRQAECLRQPLVEVGANLVITAPTSAGKSLVADVLMLQVLRSQPDKAVLMVGVLASGNCPWGPQWRRKCIKRTRRCPEWL